MENVETVRGLLSRMGAVETSEKCQTGSKELNVPTDGPGLRGRGFRISLELRFMEVRWSVSIHLG